MWLTNRLLTYHAQEALGLILVPHKIVSSGCNLSTWETETGESKVQDSPQLCRKFEASLV